MKILFTGLFVVLCAGIAICQKAPIKFGDIPIEDLKMERYNKDPSASAVILTDYGNSTITYTDREDDFFLLFERTIRIKILKKDGLDWATFKVPLYNSGSSDEKIQSIRGVTYNLENNQVVESKLKNDAIFREKTDENITTVRFTLPNVRQGSIVEVSYTVISDFLLHFQDWEFQSTIPTRWSEYRANIPEFYYYERYTQGYIPLVINEESQANSHVTFRQTGLSNAGNPISTTLKKNDFKENQYRWAAENVPAFVSEPFMTTHKDFISKIKFELAYVQMSNGTNKPVMGTWAEISRLFSEKQNVGGEISGNKFLKSTVETITAGLSTEEAKINAISNFVKHNVEWNGESTIRTVTSMKKVLENRKGNSSELNLLLGSMLEKANISVSPVLISTRDHGFVRQNTPVSTQFNYILCVARSGDKNYLLDATDPFLATGVLPERCLNGLGLAISSTGYSWVSLKSSVRSRSIYSADLALNSDGHLSGKLTLDKSGYYAHKGRKFYLSKGEGEYVKEFIGSRSWTVTKSEFLNQKDNAAPFKEMHDVVISDHAVAAESMIYLNPFLGMNYSENPFKNEKREYPVDFGSPSETMYMCKIKIPEGYSIEGIPQSKILVLPQNAAKYTYNVSQNANQVSVTSQLQINNSLFSQEEYPLLREFYSQMVAMQAEQIVLKKK